MVCKLELLSLLLIVGLCAGASADLISYHPFDEGTGTTAADVTGNGNDGTFVGAVEWVPGIKGSAVRFDVDNERILIGPLDPTAAHNAMTLAAWIKWENPPGQDQQGIFGKRIWTPRDLTKWFWEARENGRLSFRNGDQTLSAPAGTLTPYVNEWIHVAVTWDNGETIQYINAQEIHSGNMTLRTTADDTPVTIGTTQGSETFHGTIDEARIYDIALTPVQIVQAMTGDRTSASALQPVDGATDVSRDAVLSWAAGDYAAGHDVYLGTSFTDVSEASRSDGRSVLRNQNQTDVTYDPDRLQIATTYYWRIDEVNAPPDSTVHKGEVWSFTTEPVSYPVDGANITATASSAAPGDFGPEKTIDGSGLDADDLHSTGATDMWLSDNEPQGGWIQYELDRIYKLHEMWVWNSNQTFESLFGFGLKDVAIEYSINGVDWTALAGVSEFAKAPGKAGYAHDTTVDFGGTVAKFVKLIATSNWGGVLPQFGLSEVRFFYIPIVAREPVPDTGATDMDPDVTLAWRAGREAVTHNVYIGTDEQAVIDGTIPAVSVADASYSSTLDLGNTYYWRIDEVNEAETPTTWQGEVWNLSTPQYLIVEGFEDYNDYPSYEIYSTWLDGYEIPTNGSQVGNLAPPIAETGIVHGGNQSMPFFYSNTGGATYSEGARTFAVGQDWTKYGIATLVLYFHGTVGNTGQLYVKVNGVKVPYPGEATDIAELRWKQWNIDLASLGVTLTNITTLTIGVDGNGAAGTLYVDDIVLYRLAPEVVVSSEEIWIEAEAAITITDPLTIRDDPLASGGKYIGTDQGIGNESDTPPADGVATYNFTVQGGVYKISCRIIIPSGDSWWVRIPGAANLTPGEDPDNPGTGWVRWSDPPNSTGWYWYDVFSGDHNAETAYWTLPAGSYTLEIARREDGALLDAIVISKID